MRRARRDPRGIEGHYNYYGIPAYILRQKNGGYASGFFDPVDNVFKAGGAVKKILWDGVKISLTEARKLIRQYSDRVLRLGEDYEKPEWILLPDEATDFIDQLDEVRLMTMAAHVLVQCLLTDPQQAIQTQLLKALQITTPIFQNTLACTHELHG